MSLIEEVRFASDSPLEGDGFEPSVPHKKTTLLAARARSRNSPSARKTGSFVPGPMVRIHFPPAGSQVRTRHRGSAINVRCHRSAIISPRKFAKLRKSIYNWET